MLPPKFEGVPIKIGGTEYIVPPLNFKRAKKVLPLLQRMESTSGELTVEMLDAAAELVHLALSRNYPDLTIDEVEELLDMSNFRPIVDMVMGVSGVERESGEEVPGAK